MGGPNLMLDILAGPQSLLSRVAPGSVVSFSELTLRFIVMPNVPPCGLLFIYGIISVHSNLESVRVLKLFLLISSLIESSTFLGIRALMPARLSGDINGSTGRKSIEVPDPLCYTPY